MKKIILSAIALSTLFAVSCKKTDKDSTPANTWTLDGTNYSVLSAYLLNSTFSIADASGNACGFYFEGTTNTPSAGTYKVVKPKLGIGAGPGEVVVIATKAGSAGTGYHSKGNDNISATVTINGGKITVSTPRLILENISGGTDSLVFSANNIRQMN